MYQRYHYTVLCCLQCWNIFGFCCHAFQVFNIIGCCTVFYCFFGTVFKKKYFPYCYNLCPTYALCFSSCLLGTLAILRSHFLSTGTVFVLQQRRPLCGCHIDCQSTHHHAEFWEQTSWACGTHVPSGASPVYGVLQFIQRGRLWFWIREWIKQRRIWWWGISRTGGFYRGQHCPAVQFASPNCGANGRG